MTTSLPSRRTALLLAAAAVATTAGRPGVARAAAEPRATLLYVREVGCPWCREWDARIGPIYPKTPEGRRAPIREVEKRDVPTSGLTLARPVRYTPTFVLVVDKAELGRIEGYPGEEFFWARLAKLMELLPAE
ncbi:thioredoxin family protein [Rhodoplanes elegans]|uniref:thioredoxin family protein n=1 Tax=Rhodoplanes elegans TaxID=29408 RepID=UPI001FD32878|nr:thioredoxin family protein [Rhodoplanes elegans]